MKGYKGSDLPDNCQLAIGSSMNGRRLHGTRPPGAQRSRLLLSLPFLLLLTDILTYDSGSASASSRKPLSAIILHARPGSAAFLSRYTSRLVHRVMSGILPRIIEQSYGEVLKRFNADDQIREYLDERKNPHKPLNKLCGEL